LLHLFRSFVEKKLIPKEKALLEMEKEHLAGGQVSGLSVTWPLLYFGRKKEVRLWMVNATPAFYTLKVR
jgi:hypothetical protein